MIGIAMLTALAYAGEVEVNTGMAMVAVMVDGEVAEVEEGSVKAVVRGLGDGDHLVEITNGFGKIFAEMSITVGETEQVRLRYDRKNKTLSETGRGEAPAPPPPATPAAAPAPAPAPEPEQAAPAACSPTESYPVDTTKGPATLKDGRTVTVEMKGRDLMVGQIQVKGPMGVMVTVTEWDGKSDEQEIPFEWKRDGFGSGLVKLEVHDPVCPWWTKVRYTNQITVVTIE